VLKDGAPVRVPGKDLVVGDIVLMAEGDRVPADIELLEASYLTVDESLLTGESQPVLKQAREAADAGAAGPQHLCFSGSLVTQGTAQGRVVATGPRSALGRIGASLGGIARTRPHPAGDRADRRRVAMAGASIAARCWPWAGRSAAATGSPGCWPVSRWPWPSCRRNCRSC
jgi:Ca2+-transporting ATPase